MNDTFFDKKLKTALENFEAPYDPSTWAALEQRLDAPVGGKHPAPANAVDQAVFRTLERIEAPYQPEHWDLLANRMTETARLRRRLWLTKLSETAIFLLLLANLDGFLCNSASDELPLPPPPASPRLQADIPAAQKMHQDAAQHDAHNFKTGFSGTSFAVAGSGFPDVTSMPPYQGHDQLIFNILNSNNPLVPNQLTDVSVLLNPTETPDPGHWESLPPIVKLPLLLGNPLESYANPRSAGPVVQTKVPKQHRFYAATFANFDLNYVNSDDYSHSAIGYGGGMAIGYRAGKWGVEAGLAYNRKNYQPKREEEIFKGNTQNGYYGSYAKNVDADMVSVPVKVTRRIAQAGRLSAHATAGVTTNIALDKSYTYGSTYYPGQAPPDPNYAPGQAPKLRKQGRGVLEGASLDGNAYATLDAGLRLEHPLGRRFVAFVEPVYRHATGNKGIGPKPAKINTFSVQAGVLATL